MTNPIEKFFDEHPISEDMVFRDAAMHQKDILTATASLLNIDDETDIEIVGKHRSKSIDLPVVKYFLPKGSTLIVRNNFHDWAVSVVSKQPLNTEALAAIGLNLETKSSCYYEGFLRSSVFGSFLKNPQLFSTHIQSKASFEVFVNYFSKTNLTKPEPH